jgi:hypothetical protein
MHRLSYANIVATVALFTSLGGASYALVSLPPHSVGARELKPGAVTSVSLGFPLGARLFRVEAKDLTRNACNSPPTPGEPGIGCTPPAFVEGTPVGRVALKAAGRLLTVADVKVTYKGAPGTTAVTTFATFANRKPVAGQTVTLSGGQTTELSLTGLGNAQRGPNTVGFKSEARYGNLGSGDVVVEFVRIVVLAIPAL